MEFGVQTFLSDMMFLLEFPDEKQPEKYFSLIRGALESTKIRRDGNNDYYTRPLLRVALRPYVRR